MSDAREIAEKLADEISGRGPAMTVRTIERVLTAQKKAGAEEMRDRCEAVAKRWENDYLTASRDIAKTPAGQEAYRNSAIACARLGFSIAALPVEGVNDE